MSEPMKAWTTKAGLKGEIRMGMALCGYVGLPVDHPDTEKHYDHIDVDVHGGLTYAAKHDGLWWVGFDCAHAGDSISIGGRTISGRAWTVEDVEAEVEQLAEQLAARSSRCASQTGEK